MMREELFHLPCKLGGPVFLFVGCIFFRR